MKTLFIAAAAALVAKAYAECANACSGHGECKEKDQCACYDNYYGADCSLKRCPSALAFVDVPNGDLNHDGMLGRGDATVSGYSKVQWSRYMQAEYWPLTKGSGSLPYTNGGAYAAQDGEAHWYAECSGKGVCDTATGECACYDGYTGSACQRTTCPNDCSGHGICRTVKDIAAVAYNKKFVDSAGGVNTFSGVLNAFEYRLYDGDKNSACVCDSGYGGVDCSLRECPRGDDPLTFSSATCGGNACGNEIQEFILSTSTPADSKYYINFKDFNGNVWKSADFPVNLAGDAKVNNAAVKAALEALPNNVVGKEVIVTSEAFGPLTRFFVEFKFLSGNVPEFTVVRSSANTVAAMDPMVQPYEPVQKLTGTAAWSGQWTVTIDPLDVSTYREAQLTNGAPGSTVTTEAQLEAVLASINALKYELGSTPVDVVKDGDNALLIFKHNPNRPDAAKKLGYNKVRTNVATIAVSRTARDGNEEYSICSNRGMCDYSTGLCACFGGYTGAACDSLSALAQ